MGKKIAFFYYSIFAILAIWSIWSLPYSPLAWYDEVYYASTTHSLITGNGLSLELYNNEPVVAYGPIYFLLTGAVAKIFGFGIFQFRIVNLFFAFLAVIFLGKVLDKLNVKKWLNYLLQILLLTDATFFSNSHSGRMEFVALFFVLSAYWFYLNKDMKPIYRAVWVSILLTLSVLTSTRAVIVCIPIAIAQLIQFIKSHSWSAVVPYILIPIILYGIWIYAALGSLSGFISYFTQQETGDLAKGSFVSTYLKGNWLIRECHYPMIITSLFSIGYLIKKKSLNEILVPGLTILLYYILVFDTGHYGVYLLPFYMIIIGIGVSAMCDNPNKATGAIYKSLLIVCLLVNVSLIAVKSFFVLAEREQRNPQMAANWFKENIPSGCKVAGDYAFYYAAIENGCQFKSITRGGVKSEVVLEDILSNYQPDYIVLGKNNNKTEKLSLFRSSGFEMVNCLQSSQDKNTTITNLLKKANYTVTMTYEGCVYKKK